MWQVTLLCSQCSSLWSEQISTSLALLNSGCDCRGDSNKVWFAKLLVLFTYVASSGIEIEAAFVRWLVVYRPAVKDRQHAKHLTLVKLKWEEEKGRNSCADIVSLSSILGPCYVQLDPIKPDTYYFNRWVGSTF